MRFVQNSECRTWPDRSKPDSAISCAASSAAETFQRAAARSKAMAATRRASTPTSSLPLAAIGFRASFALVLVGVAGLGVVERVVAAGAEGDRIGGQPVGAVCARQRGDEPGRRTMDAGFSIAQADLVNDDLAVDDIVDSAIQQPVHPG